MRTTFAVKTAVIGLLCACTAAAMTGCFEKSEVRFGIAGDAQSGITPAVHVTYFDGFHFDEVVLDSLHHSAGPFSTGSSGDLRILCSVLSAEETPVNEASITLKLKDDWRWGVDIVFSTNNPYESCFGCIGYTSFEPDPALGLGDGVRGYIIWGGNSISNPVVY